MKKIISSMVVIIGLLFIPIITSAQEVLKWKAYSLSFHENGKWGNSESVDILITLKNDRVTIYSKETQVFDIVENEGVGTFSSGEEYLGFVCVDQNGTVCRIRLVKSQIYIYYSYLSYQYDVYRLY